MDDSIKFCLLSNMLLSSKTANGAPKYTEILANFRTVKDIDSGSCIRIVSSSNSRVHQ